MRGVPAIRPDLSGWRGGAERRGAESRVGGAGSSHGADDGAGAVPGTGAHGGVVRRVHSSGGVVRAGHGQDARGRSPDAAA
eukprot:374851-Prymnesium_polylepis.2